MKLWPSILTLHLLTAGGSVGLLLARKKTIFWVQFRKEAIFFRRAIIKKYLPLPPAQDLQRGFLNLTLDTRLTQVYKLGLVLWLGFQIPIIPRIKILSFKESIM